MLTLLRATLRRPNRLARFARLARGEFLFLATILLGCGSAQLALDTDAETRAIERVLDDWHDAAAQADEERYFGHFAADGVFLGTDATERWNVEQFREYAHPHFERGRAWAFRATERHVRIEGSLAWFDEALDTEGLGPARGSGVLRYENDVSSGEGHWKIVHYNLTITVPNERFREVKELLSRAAGEREGEAEAEAETETETETEAGGVAD